MPTWPTSGCSPRRERNLVLDINDFDETLPGPWEWDVKRLATSLEVVARSNNFSTTKRRSIVLATVTAYRRARCALRRHEHIVRVVGPRGRGHRHMAHGRVG